LYSSWCLKRNAALAAEASPISMDSEAKMDLLANIPSWGDIERNLEQ